MKLERTKIATLSSIVQSEKFHPYKAFCQYWSYSNDGTRKSIGFQIPNEFGGTWYREYWINKKHHPTWGELIDVLDEFLSEKLPEREVKEYGDADRGGTSDMRVV